MYTRASRWCTHSAPCDGTDTQKTLQIFGTNVLVLSQQREVEEAVEVKELQGELIRIWVTFDGIWGSFDGDIGLF